VTSGASSLDSAALVRADEAELSALIARMGEGDQAALSSLYDRTSARVFALALRVLRDQTAAEEVVLDVYMQAYRQAGSYEPGRGRAMAWLLSLARSRAVDRVRAEARQRRHLAPLDETAPPPSRDPDPDESTAAAEVARVVRAALDALDPEQRRVLEIAYYSGLSQSEIALALGLPLGTVKTRTRSAIMTLRRQLQTFFGEASA